MLTFVRSFLGTGFWPQDGDDLLVGMNNEDMMISNLSQVLDEEREARRAAEEENARLQTEADGEIWNDVKWWYGMVWYGIVWYGVVWQGTVL